MSQKSKSLDVYLREITIYSMYIFAVMMPFSIAITQIALGIAFVAWLGRIFITRQAKCGRINLEWAFAAYIAAELLALAFSTNLPQSVVYLKRLLLIPIVYLFAHNVEEERQFNRLLFIFVLALTFYSAWGTVSYFLDPSVRVRHIQNSMTAGGLTMIGALAGFAISMLAKKGGWRIAGFSATALNVACLMLTSTRGSWLGFFFGAVMIFFFTKPKALFAVPLLIAAFYFLQPAGFAHRVRHFFDPTWETNAKRLLWWSVGVEVFKDHPVVGIGDVNAARIYRQYAPAEVQETIGHFHSNYVHIAVTLGTVGLIAFLFMLVRIFQALYKVVRQSRQSSWPLFAGALAAISIFTAFNVNGFFEWNFGDAEIITMIWFVVGLALAIPRLKPQLTYSKSI
jgi:putative inorganic carbon (HCO3(-)) transporter